MIAHNKIPLHWVGDANNNRVVIYVHGFAVNYTSRGLFTDLAETLKESGLSSILFDLSSYDEQGQATFGSLSEQQARLQNVYQQVVRNDRQLYVVAHSMGCGVLVSMSPQLPFNKVLLLAPGNDHPGPRIKKYLLEKRGGREIQPQLYGFRRKNGLMNYFPQSYVDEFDVAFSDLYLNNLSGVSNLQIYLAEEDLPNYNQSFEAVFKKYPTKTIAGADHNFTGHHRSEIQKLTLEFFST